MSRIRVGRPGPSGHWFGACESTFVAFRIGPHKKLVASDGCRTCVFRVDACWLNAGSSKPEAASERCSLPAPTRAVQTRVPRPPVAPSIA